MALMHVKGSYVALALALLCIALAHGQGNPNSAPYVYFGGVFTNTPGSAAQLGGAGIWNYVNATWQEGGASNPVSVLTSLLHENRLYMAGEFGTIGNIASTGQKPIAAAVAYLDTNTQAWTAVATNGNGPVYDVAIHPSTGRLWAVGGMTLLAPTLTGTGGVGEYHEDLGTWVFAGYSPTEFIVTTETTPVKAIAFDGSGMPIIGGTPGFSASTRDLRGLARMNSDKEWEVLGNGICGGSVEDMVVWGDKLYIGGTFSKINDVNGDCGVAATDAPGFAIYDLGTNSWDGTAGASLSSGDAVHAFQLTDFGARNETSHLADFLLVAGYFASLNGNAALKGIAKFDGTTWSAAAPVVAPIGTGLIRAVHTDGFNLYIGGNFSTANTTNAAVWDGAQWNTLNGGLFCITPYCYDSSVHTISAFYTLTSEVVTPLQWGGFDLSKYINWKYWLICLCAVLALALILSLLTNCCWKVVSCCRGSCLNSKPREKEPGL
jgi:hypothetical protein